MVTKLPLDEKEVGLWYRKKPNQSNINKKLTYSKKQSFSLAPIV